MVEVLRLLLEAGANRNVADNDCWTALTAACRCEMRCRQKGLGFRVQTRLTMTAALP